MAEITKVKPGTLTDFGNGFRHIRGSFKLGGMVDLGTHCALVELPDGRFVFLDSYTLDEALKAKVDALTDGGKKVAAIINLHPFHTLHIEWMAKAYPQAKLYGTKRHHEKFPGLKWESDTCQASALDGLFGDALAFSVPEGVQMVCEDENVHFSSVLAYHRPSKTIFVDDTLSCIKAPFPLSLLPMTGDLGFHPTLAKALEPNPNAADAFREWAIHMGQDWADARRVATAHNATMELAAGEFPTKVGAALGKVANVLKKHRKVPVSA
ncbi:hypothetical protein [Alteriqipengyuania lutimaris]|uniref:MBL fold metallo-hydrolase n=1 Tax=Alteriqipengyuania lutimaris TaxID=1538146 RepID=A0A395LNC3_9SPHN|nr:hypothetical protein [Alteriqipengyuania lutimaris]MBB3032640.1 hypothetical protein [Alteriqipengyuania lutimaris]RDS78245.1 hypothetical protein DL238_11930 [Alteriqipengyuania lutimaris]